MNNHSATRVITRVTRSLRPGQAGTLKLLRRYGDRLLVVRYREDANGKTRYTTIELVVDEGPVQKRLSTRTIVRVRIAWGEANLSARAKTMGAKWEPSTGLWRMTFGTAQALELIDRIQPKLSTDGHRD